MKYIFDIGYLITIIAMFPIYKGTIKVSNAWAFAILSIQVVCMIGRNHYLEQNKRFRTCINAAVIVTMLICGYILFIK